MSRIILLSLGLLLSLSAFAQDLSLQGFKERFTLVRNGEGKVTVIKLKKAVTKFTIKPFLEQIKADLQAEQDSFAALSAYDKEEEIDGMLMDMGLDPYAKGNGSDEAKKIKEALLNIPNINVEAAFNKVMQGDFWAEFQRRLQEALLF